MKGYTSDTIRNVVLVGHGGCGKTTLLEAALLATGVINRLGRVEDGNTVSDYDKMEIEKGYSISTSVVPVEYNKYKINFIDTPGYFDFIGEVYSAMRAVEAAVIMVDASSGIQVGTEKAWKTCKEHGIPTFFLINKIDKENVEVDKVIDDLKSKFGTSVVQLSEKDSLTEAIAESDEELLEKFFNGEAFTEEEVNRGLASGIAAGNIIPVMTCCALDGRGIKEFLDTMIKLVPIAKDDAEYKGVDEKDNEIVRKCDPNAPVSAFVFKTIADPFVGKISLIKVTSGKMSTGELYNTRTEKPEKIGNLFFLRGKTHLEADLAVAGDIVAAPKLQFTQTGDTLCEKANYIKYPGVFYPEPSLYMAVEPKEKGDDEKISAGLNKLMEEDPSFVLERNTETHQTLIGGQGEIQIGISIAKLKDKFGVGVELVDQKIPYRETIKGSSDVQGKHKKQSGGAGQYGDVHIRFSPSLQEDFEFSEELFGGSVPKNYVPAVEKGLRESMEKGPLAGYPVVNIKAVFYDGSYHDVDSNEMAFKIAASLAFKKGIVEAKPILLEPVMHVEILVPDEYMGDIMGDMNKRRGKILGMEPQQGGDQKVLAEAPMAEMFKYAITLRSMTQARGSFTMKFERYEEVPAHLAEKIIADHKSEEE
ncbi:MAG: elongation factor G [Eubacteriales bacterium]|nr:elongation factor G [Eubacteriales bacterium]